MSDLFEQFGNTQQTPDNDGIIGKFNEFAKNFQGDPKQKVQELLASGKMTQQQFEQFSNMAKMFQGKMR